MYDYSLLEQYSNVKYNVDIFNITHPSEGEEERVKLGLLMSRITEESNVKFVMRKDYHSMTTGDLFVHVEWFSYDLEKVSPFMKPTIINPGAVPD